MLGVCTNATLAAITGACSQAVRTRKLTTDSNWPFAHHGNNHFHFLCPNTNTTNEHDIHWTECMQVEVCLHAKSLSSPACPHAHTHLATSQAQPVCGENVYLDFGREPTALWDPCLGFHGKCTILSSNVLPTKMTMAVTYKHRKDSLCTLLQECSKYLPTLQV